MLTLAHANNQQVPWVTNQISHNVITAGSVERMIEERVGCGCRLRIIVVLLGGLLLAGVPTPSRREESLLT